MDLVGLGEQFGGHYWPSQEEFTSLWADGALALDASVLLSFHRYSNETRAALLRIVGRFSGRVFVPYQAAEEYQRNRLAVIAAQVATYEDLEQDLATAMESLEKRARQLQRHPVLEAEEVLTRLDRFKQDLIAYIDERKHAHPNVQMTPERLMRDPVRDEIAVALGSAVGAPYDDGRQKAALGLAAERYANEIPPGYLDQKKGDARQFGDAIFWMQTLDYATETKRPIIVVTDDEKEDWWWRPKGKTLGPRPELVAEMKVASGHRMFMYTSRGLLEAARRYLAEVVSDAALDEAERVAKDRNEDLVVEFLACPHCETDSLRALLGRSLGSSAIVRCPECEHRFHAHRTAEGGVRTTRGSLGKRVVTACPTCSRTLSIDFPDTDHRSKQYACVECLSLLEVEPSGHTEVIGRTQVVDSWLIAPKRLWCPHCEVDHPSFTSDQGRFSVCYTQKPPMLLREGPSPA